MKGWSKVRQHGSEAAVDVPLCVDLDGTLIRTDMLVESVFALLAQRPLALFLIPGWLARGKANLKKQLALRIELDPASLPYHYELLSWLKGQRQHRHVVLCTASDESLASLIAEHTGVFDEVIASDGAVNLSGPRKAEALSERFGEKQFDYVGNARVDLAVWRRARAAIVIEPGRRLSAAASKVAVIEKRFPVARGGLGTWAKALRVHQWIKNLLVFLPLLAAHRLFETRAVLSAILAFVCFSLCASSVYLTNDLLDLSSDRQHKRKRHRPFAMGALPLVAGPIVALLLLVSGFGLAMLGSIQFVVVLLGYYLLTTAYSFWLKRIVMLDAIALAGLYTSRILAGSAAMPVAPSFWMLAFSMFLFLSLAMVKRYVELESLQASGKVKATGRGYDVGDISLVQSLGASSGYLAVLVLALYIDSTASVRLYAHPQVLWALCPLLLYWISRTWAVAHRGAMHDDPVVFAVTDRVSQILGLIAAVIVTVAI